MKYIYLSCDYRAITNIGYTLVAAGINVAVIVAINGLNTILNTQHGIFVHEPAA